MSVAIPSPAERGYKCPEMLATTDWLNERLSDPSIRVVDVDLPGEYPRAHIPGAVPVKDHYYKELNGTHIQGPEEFAATMSSLGISDDTTVVPYDSNGGLWATRLAWCLMYYGHDKVKVLDGGFPQWFTEGRPLSREPARPKPGKFTPRPDPSVMATRQQVLEVIGDQQTVLLDVRSRGEWTGENRRDCMRGGRIPGAVHMEWTNFLTDGEAPHIRPADELRCLLAEAGITPEKKVVTY